MIENDCEDQGETDLSEGCRVCQTWNGDFLDRAEIKDRGDGHLCCVRCRGSYGIAGKTGEQS